MNSQQRIRVIESLQLELFLQTRQLPAVKQLELEFKRRIELVKKQGTKTCSQCGEEKDAASNFYQSDNYKDGYMNPCRQCKCANGKLKRRRAA